jgi:hypothetical protein
VRQRAFVLALHCVALGQPAQGIQSQTLEALPLEQQPFFKDGAVGERKALQKLATIPLYSIFEFRDGVMRGLQRRGESLCIDPGIAVAIELDRLPRGEQKGRRSLSVSDHLPEICQRMAQVRPGGAFGKVRP